MNTISYEGVVFTRGCDTAFPVRLIKRSIASPERIMRVRIKESSFCLRTLRATLASLPDCGGKVDAGPCPDNLLGRRVIAWQRQTLCATVMATGETLDLRELRCRCNLEYRFAYADGKPLDRQRQLWCVEPARSAISSTFKPNYSRLILARWQGFRRYCQ